MRLRKKGLDSRVKTQESKLKRVEAVLVLFMVNQSHQQANECRRAVTAVFALNDAQGLTLDGRPIGVVLSDSWCGQTRIAFSHLALTNPSSNDKSASLLTRHHSESVSLPAVVAKSTVGTAQTSCACLPLFCFSFSCFSQRSVGPAARNRASSWPLRIDTFCLCRIAASRPSSRPLAYQSQHQSPRGVRLMIYDIATFRKNV